MASGLPRSQGFTLIEMLVALTLFASLTAVAMFGFSQGLSLWERANKRSVGWQSLEFRHGLLRSLFLQGLEADYVEAGGVFVPLFEGTERTMRFISRSSLMSRPGQSQVVELKLEPQTGGSFSLGYSESNAASVGYDGISQRQSESLILLEDLYDAEFYYEAPAYPRPEELRPDLLSEAELRRYRNAPEWLEDFHAAVMWRIPQRVLLSFNDEEGRPHRWVFLLPQATDAWSLEGTRDL